MATQKLPYLIHTAPCLTLHIYFKVILCVSACAWDGESEKKVCLCVCVCVCVCNITNLCTGLFIWQHVFNILAHFFYVWAVFIRTLSFVCGQYLIGWQHSILKVKYSLALLFVPAIIQYLLSDSLHLCCLMLHITYSNVITGTAFVKANINNPF